MVLGLEKCKKSLALYSVDMAPNDLIILNKTTTHSYEAFFIDVLETLSVNLLINILTSRTHFRYKCCRRKYLLIIVIIVFFLTKNLL